MHTKKIAMLIHISLIHYHIGAILTPICILLVASYFSMTAKRTITIKVAHGYKKHLPSKVHDGLLCLEDAELLLQYAQKMQRVRVNIDAVW